MIVSCHGVTVGKRWSRGRSKASELNEDYLQMKSALAAVSTVASLTVMLLYSIQGEVVVRFSVP